MSETKESAGDLFKAGRLAEAVEAAGAAVKKSPSDLGARVLLAEMLIFAGNLERADVILDAASQVDTSAAVVVAEFRQLLRADMARRQLRRDGRVPEFLDGPTPALTKVMACLVALRAGDHEGAAREAAEAEALRPHVPGQLGEVAFDDFRDADDLSIGFFEVLTTTGKYFWIPTERVETIEFHPPKRPRDLLWRRASMVVKAGPDGEVYIPAIYGNDEPDLAEPYKLGRATDWRENGGPVVGVGQRTFLAGDNAVDIMQLGAVTFAAA